MSACLSCGHSGVPLGYSKRQPLERCSSCHLVFAERWGEGFNTIHEDPYIKQQAEEYEYDPLNLARLDLLLADAERTVRKGRLLDVGCGHGDTVFAAQSRGWAAKGIDLASAAILLCQRKGLPCTQTDFFAPELDSERFDFITMSEFIEHVPFPIKFLTRARELLSPGGIVYVTTPNFDSLSRRVLQGEWPPIHPEHIAYFTRRTLVGAAKAAGLEVSRFESRNVSMAVPANLRRRVARLLHRGPEEAPGGSKAGEAPVDATQALRRRLASSVVLGFSRDVVNSALNATDLGESLFGWFARS